MLKRNKFTVSSLLMLLAGVAENILGAKLAVLCGWPVFLDCVGTVSIAALGGPVLGVAVGLISNIINSLSDSITLYYGVISTMIAVIAARMSSKRMFRSFGGALAAALVFAFCGGVLGSVITWLLNGLAIGTGISAPYAHQLAEQYGMSDFSAQLTADFLIDLIDKAITVAIVYAFVNIAPKRFLARLPYGSVYTDERVKSAEDKKHNKKIRPFRKVSLKSKVTFSLIIAFAVISTVATTIGFAVYKGTTDSKYIKQCCDTAELIRRSVNADEVNKYLADGVKTEEYLQTENELIRIYDSLTEIKYIYVYQIREDGCHVVFDVETEDTPAGELGEVVPFDEGFKEDLPALLRGEEIEPVILNGSFGWLLTVYEPITDSDGNCVAYAAADIDMGDVIADRYAFFAKMLSLLLGTAMVIIVVAIRYFDSYFVEPVNKLAAAAGSYAFSTDSDRRGNAKLMEDLDIKTGDELENLYTALAKTFYDVDSYLDLIDEKTAENEQKAALILQMQDNIIISFAGMVESRDEDTGNHIMRTVGVVHAITNRLSCENGRISPKYAEDTVKSAPLHDIGKIKIPDAILLKPGRLTASEFEIVKTHTTSGGQIIDEALKGIERTGYLSIAKDMALYHHEKWDGTGYPMGLKGEEIPFCARIMAVADVFDALASKRCYKEAMSVPDAVALIRAESGKHFDPKVVDAFLFALDEIRGLYIADDDDSLQHPIPPKRK